jgi:hypothetical protein
VSIWELVFPKPLRVLKSMRRSESTGPNPCTAQSCTDKQEAGNNTDKYCCTSLLLLTADTHSHTHTHTHTYSESERYTYIKLIRLQFMNTNFNINNNNIYNAIEKQGEKMSHKNTAQFIKRSRE